MNYKVEKLEDLFPQLPKNQETPKLTFYIPSVSEEIDTEKEFPCVLVCPGGGYWWTSEREAEPVALRLLGQGIAACVLDYSTKCQHYPIQLLQASAALTYLRRHHKELHIKKDHIYVMGFSAGGHVACSLGTLWQDKLIKETLKIQHGENRPDGMILVYPVITNGKFGHADSFKCLLGENPDSELFAKMSLENQVTENCPPAFIFHTAEDGLVPVENSLLLANAMSAKKIPFELHIFPKGGHGSSLCDETVNKNSAGQAEAYNSEWVNLAVKWIKTDFVK